MIDGLSSNTNFKAMVLPSASECRICSDTAEIYKTLPDCKRCHKEKEVTVLQFVKNFFGTYVVAINDKGLIEEIPTHLIKTDI